MFLTENTHCGGLDSFLLYLINSWPSKEDKLTIICNASHPGLANIKSGVGSRCEVLSYDISTYSSLIEKANQNLFLRGVRITLSPLLKYGYFLYYLLKLRTLFLNKEMDRLMVVNGGHPGGDTCRAAVIAWRMSVNGKPPAV